MSFKVFETFPLIYPFVVVFYLTLLLLVEIIFNIIMFVVVVVMDFLFIQLYYIQHYTASHFFCHLVGKLPFSVFHDSVSWKIFAFRRVFVMKSCLRTLFICSPGDKSAAQCSACHFKGCISDK